MWKKLLRVVWKRPVIAPLRSAEEGDLAKSLLRRKPLLLVSVMSSLLTLLDELRFAPQRRLGRHAPPLLLGTPQSKMRMRAYFPHLRRPLLDAAPLKSALILKLLPLWRVARH